MSIWFSKNIRIAATEFTNRMLKLYRQVFKITLNWQTSDLKKEVLVATGMKRES